MTDDHPDQNRPDQNRPDQGTPGYDRSQRGDATFEICEIESEASKIWIPREAILKRLKQFAFDDKAIFAIKLALEEAIANAISHGNDGDCTKKITVRYSVDDRRAAIIVNDQGCGFKPENVPDPTQPDRLSVPNGRGIMLMRAYTDEIEFRNDGCEVYFVKYRK